MRKSLIKFLSIILSSISILNTSFNSFAYALDADGNSIDQIEYQTTDDDNFSNASNIFAELSSIYKIVIPKTVVLSGESKDATYFVKAEGDIAGYEILNIVPDDKFNLYTKNKDLQIANITQDKTAWKYNDFDIDANGRIDAKGITAGKWSGTFNFNIFLKNLEDEEKVAGDIIVPYDLDDNYKLVISKLKKNAQPGIYNSEGELIKSYDYLALHDNVSSNAVLLKGKTGSLSNAILNYPDTTFVVLPNTIKTIETGSLNNLEYVNVPTSVTRIENNAFTNVNYVDIPDTVSYVGSQNTKSYSNGRPVQIITVDLENNNSADIVLEKGYTYQIEALYNFTDDVTGQSTITSSDNNIVQYRPVYFIDALEIGDCTLSGTYCAINGKKDASINVTVIDTHEHKRSNVITENRIEPSCTKKGSFEEVVYCTICNKVLSRSKKDISSLGHSYNSGKITKEATCTVDGVKTYTCNRCNGTKTEKITKLGHNYVDYKCTRCDAEMPVDGNANFDLSFWQTLDSNYTTATYVKIPSYIAKNGKTYKITGLNNRTFYNNQKIRTIILPETLTSIPAEAFFASENLSYLYIPHSVKSIGKDAFYDTGGQHYDNNAQFKIRYDGTKEEWNAMNIENTGIRYSDAYQGGPNVIVTCNDGEISYKRHN